MRDGDWEPSGETWREYLGAALLAGLVLLMVLAWGLAWGPEWWGPAWQHTVWAGR